LKNQPHEVYAEQGLALRLEQRAAEHLAVRVERPCRGASRFVDGGLPEQDVDEASRDPGVGESGAPLEHLLPSRSTSSRRGRHAMPGSGRLAASRAAAVVLPPAHVRSTMRARGCLPVRGRLVVHESVGW
jgi:hypothetical protein